MALGAFREPALVERALALALSDAVPTQDVVPLLARLLANPDGARAHLGVHPRALGEALAARLAGPRVAAGLGAAGAAEAALPPPGRELLRDAPAADGLARAAAGARALRPRRRAARADRARPARVPALRLSEREWSLSEELLARPFASVREACAEVAAVARHVAIDAERARALRRAIPLDELGASPTSLPARSAATSRRSRRSRSASTRSTSARAGSRSSPSARGSRATARSRRACASASSATGAFTARELRGIDARAVAQLLGQTPLAAPIDELMELFATRAARPGRARRRRARADRSRASSRRRAAPPPRSCAASSRCRSTATSRARRDPRAVPEARAAHGLGSRARAAREPRPLPRPGRAHDLRRQPGAARAPAGRRAALRARRSSRASTPEQTDPGRLAPRRSRSAPARSTRSSRWSRACARASASVCARDLDDWLWRRGGEPAYKARPRHRTRCPYY